MREFGKALYEAKSVLLSNEKIRKLLYNDGRTALVADVPTVEAANSYISIVPYLKETEHEKENKNTIMYLSFARVEKSGGEYSAVLEVLIATSVDNYELDGYKLRLFELCDEIEQTLNKGALSIPVEGGLSSLQAMRLGLKPAMLLTFVLYDAV